MNTTKSSKKPADKLKFFQNKLKKEEEKCIALIEKKVKDKIKKIEKEMEEKEKEREEIEEDVVNFPGHPGSTSGLRMQWGEEDDYYREQIQALKDSIETEISELGYRKWKKWNEDYTHTIKEFNKNPDKFDRKLSDILVEDHTIPQLFTDLYEDHANMDRESWYEAWEEAIEDEKKLNLRKAWEETLES